MFFFGVVASPYAGGVQEGGGGDSIIASCLFAAVLS